MRKIRAVTLVAYLAGGLLFGNARAGDITPELERLYLGKGQALVAYEPRALSLNAHTEAFLYSPVGDRIAYISRIVSTNIANTPSMTTAVNLVSTRTGETVNYWQDTVVQSQTDRDSMPHGASAVQLLSWSDDSVYLAFSTVRYVQDSHGGLDQKSVIQVLDLLHQTVQPVPMPADPNAIIVPSDIGWIPGANLLPFLMISTVAGAKQWSLYLYNPATHDTKVCALGEPLLRHERVQLLGWLDNHRLMFLTIGPNVHTTKQDRPIYTTDINTGTTVKAPERMPAIVRSFEDKEDREGIVTVLVSDLGDLAIAMSEQAIMDVEKKPHGQERSVWITGPKSRLAKRRLFVDVFPRDETMWSQAQFAPDSGSGYGGQYQVAYLSHGDVKVADLVVQPATASEKLAAGETLSCTEERQIALSDAKQIGLSLMQYVQDYDEHYPPTSNFHEGVMPYLRSTKILTSMSKYPFQYTPPSNLSLAAMDNVAQTSIGYYDLPCGKIVLYADGHVRAEN